MRPKGLRAKVEYAYLLSTLLGAPFTHGGVHYQTIKPFALGTDLGENPSTPVTVGSDGNLYGTCNGGGPLFAGTVFSVKPDASGFRVLHNFGVMGDGQYPVTGLVEGKDGALYGATGRGGASDAGTVFKIGKDGSGYTLLLSFNTNGLDGQLPVTLLEGTDGALYGTTAIGGGGAGTVFRLNKDGSSYITLASFRTSDNNGQYPNALLEGSDGPLYGTTGWGGAYATGTVFKINKDGSGYTVLHSFGNTNGDGKNPTSLIQANDGTLYGTTGSQRGDTGTVFKIHIDGSGYTVLYSFGKTSGDGLNPTTLLEGGDNALYGTTVYGGAYTNGTVFKINRDGSAYNLLHSFGNCDTDGQNPLAGLAMSKDGTYYGTTFTGGPYTGTLFRIKSDGSNYAVLYGFGAPSEDASLPSALIEGTGGLLYGTTIFGGANNVGTVFKVGRDGNGYSLLFSFTTNVIDGHRPKSIVQGSDSALYGTTSEGGNGRCYDALGLSVGCGTVFKLNTDGTGYMVLHSFGGAGSVDGEFPNGVVEGSDGMLYGTTSQGGTGWGGPFLKSVKTEATTPFCSISTPQMSRMPHFRQASWKGATVHYTERHPRVAPASAMLEPFSK